VSCSRLHGQQREMAELHFLLRTHDQLIDVGCSSGSPREDETIDAGADDLEHAHGRSRSSCSSACGLRRAPKYSQ